MKKRLIVIALVAIVLFWSWATIQFPHTFAGLEVPAFLTVINSSHHEAGPFHTQGYRILHFQTRKPDLEKWMDTLKQQLKTEWVDGPVSRDIGFIRNRFPSSVLSRNDCKYLTRIANPGSDDEELEVLVISDVARNQGWVYVQY